MDGLLDQVQAAVDAVRAQVEGREVSELAPGELIAVNKAFGVLRRCVDAAYLPVAAEIGRQSRPELGRDSLARRQGFGTPGKLISATTGSSVGEALKLVAVGEATAPRATLTGQPAPARHPHVAEAVQAGRIGVAASAAIVRMLDKVMLRADRDAVEAMEQRLVQAAPGLTLDQLNTLILRAEALLDPDGVEPREGELYANRSLVVRREASGAVALTGRFDPETAAPILAVIDNLVSGMLRRRNDTTTTGTGVGAAGTDEDAGNDAAAAADVGVARSNADTDTTTVAGAGEAALTEDAPTLPAVDDRTVTQMRADALSETCRHLLGCDAVPTGVSTTVVVRMNLEDLQADLQASTGAGAGMIDGLAQPVSAGTVRRMAADAQIIPLILGGASEILDWGRGKRLFTPAQKLALVERDGGCAFCGAPPSITVAHHIRWWCRDAGPTDLDNGILLCTSCHHRIHDDGWEIRIDGPGTRANVWFIPPPWLDSTRTPRLGGRARYDLTG
jgi:hypothetical protein